MQHHLFAALRKTRLIPESAAWTAVNYSRSGRTDKGVSAFGQVVALHVRSTVKEGEGLKPQWNALTFSGMISVGTGISDNSKELEYVSILNRVLPSDIRILGWAPVPSDFNARHVHSLSQLTNRFSTKSRTYKYLFANPNNYLNVERMLEAAKSLEGEHDFRNFCKLDVNASHWTRSITSLEISPFSTMNIFGSENVEELPPNQSELSSSCFVCTITGSGFLWHQIRCIMYILFLIGIGKEKPSVIRPESDSDHIRLYLIC